MKIAGYAVFSIPTKEAKLFAGARAERVSDIYPVYNDDLQNVLESFQIGGYMDEFISGYSIRPVKE